MHNYHQLQGRREAQFARWAWRKTSIIGTRSQEPGLRSWRGWGPNWAGDVPADAARRALLRRPGRSLRAVLKVVLRRHGLRWMSAEEVQARPERVLGRAARAGAAAGAVAV